MPRNIRNKKTENKIEEIKFRVNQEDKVRYTQIAKKNHISLNEYIRQSVEAQSANPKTTRKQYVAILVEQQEALNEFRRTVQNYYPVEYANQIMAQIDSLAEREKRLWDC